VLRLLQGIAAFRGRARRGAILGPLLQLARWVVLGWLAANLGVQACMATYSSLHTAPAGRLTGSRPLLRSQPDVLSRWPTLSPTAPAAVSSPPHALGRGALRRARIDDHQHSLHRWGGLTVLAVAGGWLMRALSSARSIRRSRDPAWNVLMVEGAWRRGRVKCLKRLMGHTGGVSALLVSPDGLSIYSASWDNTIGVWNRVTGERMGSWTGHTDEVLALSITADGKRLASSSKDGTIRIWDTATGGVMQTIPGGHTDTISCLAITSDGRTVISGSHDTTIGVFDVATGAKRRTLYGHSSCVSCLAMYPDDKRFVSGSWDCHVRVWDLLTGMPLSKLFGHQERVLSVAVSPDGRRLASGSLDRTLHLWDGSDGRKYYWKPNSSPPDLPDSGVQAVTFSPDNTRLMTGGADGNVRIWDANAGVLLWTMVGHTAAVSAVAFSPDGRRLVSGSWDGTICFWSARSGATESGSESPFPPRRPR